MPGSLRHTYRFDGYELDAEDRRLRHRGRVVPLRPKPFETLLYLARHAGHLVTKTELLAELWAGTVVSESALTRCIKEIRRALGDDARAPRFIETRAGLGYAFLAPVGATAEVGRLSTIAIQPVADLSPEHRLASFAEGLTEELTAALTRAPGLRVVNGVSVPADAGAPRTLPALGHRLGADAVLKGSVRASGRHLRVTLQLVDADSGYHLWSAIFDRRLGDPLALQAEISQRVVRRLAENRIGPTAG